MNTRLFLTLVAALFCGTALSDEKKSDGVTHVDAAGAEKLVKAGTVKVLDVRTPDEYKEGHIASAVNIDFTGSDFEKQVSALDKAGAYLVHCQSGRRSTNSLEIFQKLGFKSIYHLDGGMKAWQKAGLPVAK